MKWLSALGLGAALILCAAPGSVYAQDDSDQYQAQEDSDQGQATQSEEDSSSDNSAASQLDNAAEDGQEAVDAPTDEDAKAESNETFDTPHDADGN